MSETKRYDVGMTTEFNPHGFNHSFPRVYEAEQGKYVEYADYARLKAEVERLKAENESLQTKATNIYNAMVVRCKAEEITHKANADSIISQGMMSEAMKLMEESIAIREQVERLTKAGDAMAGHIERNDERCYIVLPYGDLRIADWNAAKEGKPRA